MFYRSFLLVCLVAAGCSSSKKHNVPPDYSHLTKLNPPAKQKYKPSKAYVDSVKMIDHDDQKALMLSGNLADGCTQLYKASHAMHGDTLTISLTAWRPANKMCAQALVPFQFIYSKVDPAKLKKITAVNINDNEFKLKK